MMGLVGLELHKDISGLVPESIGQTGEQLNLLLLDQFRREQFYRLIGSSLCRCMDPGLESDQVQSSPLSHDLYRSPDDIRTSPGFFQLV